MNSSTHQDDPKRRLLWAVAYLLAAAWPLAVGIERPGITGYERAMLPDMIHGTAWQPFVKRQLVPLVVRGGLTLPPQSLDDRLRQVFERSSIVQKLRWPAQYAPEFVLSLVVMYASMLAFLVVLRKFLRTLLEISEGGSHAAVLVVAVGLPISFAGKLYIYDFTQLLLFTAGLLCMYQRRWWWYYPLFALACLNKETSILLVAVFACWIGRRAFESANLAHIAAQAVIGLGICAVLAWIFRHNPGGGIEWHLQRNLSPPITKLAMIRLAVLVLAIILALWRFRGAPVFVSRGFLVTLLPLLVATLFFGYVDELRDYYEALPFGLCLVLLTLGKRWGVYAREARRVFTAG